MSSSIVTNMPSKEADTFLSAPKPRRELGLFTATCLIVGNMVGTGVFLLPAALAPFGSYAIIGWLISTVGAVCLAFIFSYLARRIPLSGGIYAYSRKTFGDYIGFQVAWNYWIAACVGNAAFLIGIPAYLSILFPSLAEDRGLGLIVGFGIYWSFVAIHCLGIKEAAFVQNVTTILKLLPLLLIPMFGLFFIQIDHFAFQMPSSANGSIFKVLAETTILTIWAFIGIESATIPAQAIKNPEKTIPRATILGVLISAFIYISGAIAIIGLVSSQELIQSQAPYALAAGKLFPNISSGWVEGLIALGAIIAGLGTLNGWILLQTQMPYAASKDGLFPKIFEKGMHKGTPIFGLLVSSAIITIFLLMSQSDSLVDQYVYVFKISAFSVVVCYIYPVVASLLLVKHPRKRSFYGLLAVVMLAIIYLIWAMIGAGHETVFLGSILFFASTPIYFWVKKGTFKEYEKN